MSAASKTGQHDTKAEDVLLRDPFVPGPGAGQAFLKDWWSLLTSSSQVPGTKGRERRERDERAWFEPRVTALPTRVRSFSPPHRPGTTPCGGLHIRACPESAAEEEPKKKS